ncbi:MAG: hypothetical protein AUK43_11705 [Oscillatoriales cyanobacterium CG2_30_40_61]|nr:MAG: hypothetical protein AUK43_11705 [Oscillatoriales cyanobacterium CG2_30_40_61]
MKSEHKLTPITWFSFGLLLVTCLNFGWFLFESSWYSFISGLFLGLIWSIDLFFTLPLNKLNTFVLTKIRTDWGTFLMIVFLSILSVFMIIWIKVSINLLLMVSATALARLELQTARFKDGQSFIILSILSTLGLILGWGLNHYFSFGHLESQFCLPFHLGCIHIPDHGEIPRPEN